MTKRYEVVFTPRALRQLDHLYTTIADDSGAVRASNYVGKIVETCQSLSLFPERGTTRSDLRPNLRTMGLAKRLTIAFSVNHADGTAAIHGVFYGGQDFESVLRETISDE